MRDVAAGRPLLQLIRLAYGAGRPVLLVGSHGVGKSEIMEAAARELGIDCCVIDLSLCEPMDLIGLPVLSDGVTRFAPPAGLPTEGRGLLVLEEINRAPRHVRAPCLQLLTARRLNDYRLPDGWLPVACANPAGNQYDVDDLDLALLSRFIQVRVQPDLDEWLSWAERNKIHSAIIDFVRHANVKALTTGEGNPRAWAYASTLLRQWEADGLGDQDLLCDVLVGVLGDKWGMELLRAHSGANARVSPRNILTDWTRLERIVARWRDTGRVDLLKSAWADLWQYLRSAKALTAYLRSQTQQDNVRNFVGLLPAAMAREANENLRELRSESHVVPFPAKRASRSRRAR